MNSHDFDRAAAQTRLHDKNICLAWLRLVEGLSYKQIKLLTGATREQVRRPEYRIRWVLNQGDHKGRPYCRYC